MVGFMAARFFFVCATVLLPASVLAETMGWNLAEDYRTGTRCENPNTDRYGEPTWQFLRTTGTTSELPNRSGCATANTCPWNTMVIDFSVDRSLPGLNTRPATIGSP